MSLPPQSDRESPLGDASALENRTQRIADKVLLEAARDGDRSCLATLANRLGPSLRGYFLARTEDPTASTRLAQKTLRRIVSRARRPDDPASLERYARRIGMGVLRSSRRTRKTAWCQFCLWVDQLGLVTRGDQQLARRIRSMLHRLSLDERQWLFAYFGRQQSATDIADQLRRSEAGIGELMASTVRKIWTEVLPDADFPDEPWLAEILLGPRDRHLVESLRQTLLHSPSALASFAQWMELADALYAAIEEVECESPGEVAWAPPRSYVLGDPWGRTVEDALNGRGRVLLAIALLGMLLLAGAGSLWWISYHGFPLFRGPLAATASDDRSLGQTSQSNMLTAPRHGTHSKAADLVGRPSGSQALSGSEFGESSTSSALSAASAAERSEGPADLSAQSGAAMGGHLVGSSDAGAMLDPSGGRREPPLGETLDEGRDDVVQLPRPEEGDDRPPLAAQAWRFAVFQAVYHRDWEMLAELARRTDPQTLAAGRSLWQWANAQREKAPAGPSATGDSLSVRPLVRQFDRATYQWVIEFESALAAAAWEDAQNMLLALDPSFDQAPQGALPELDAWWSPRSEAPLGMPPRRMREFQAALGPSRAEPDLFVSRAGAIERGFVRHAELREFSESQRQTIARQIERAMQMPGDSAILDVCLRYPQAPEAASGWERLGRQALVRQRPAVAVGRLRRAAEAAGGATGAIRAVAAAAVVAMGHSPPQVEIDELVWSEHRFDGEMFRGLLESIPNVVSARKPQVNVNQSFRPRTNVPLGLGQSHQNPRPPRYPGLSTRDGRTWASAIAGSQLILNDGRQVRAINLETGQQQWETPPLEHQVAAAEPPMSPQADHRHVVARLATNVLVSLARETGELRWRFAPPPGTLLVSDPILLPDGCYGLAIDKRVSPWLLLLYQLDPASGALAQLTPLVPLGESWQHFQHCQWTMWLDRCVASLGGAIVVFDLDGRVYWARELPSAPRFVDPAGDRAWDVPPLCENGRIWTVQPGVKTVTCLDLATGERLWQTVLPDALRWVARDRTSIVVQETEALTALSRVDGRITWRRAAPGAWCLGSWDLSNGHALLSWQPAETAAQEDVSPRLGLWDLASGKLERQWGTRGSGRPSAQSIPWAAATASSIWLVLHQANGLDDLWEFRAGG